MISAAEIRIITYTDISHKPGINYYVTGLN